MRTAGIRTADQLRTVRIAGLAFNLPRASNLGKQWWAQRGSNPRPLVCKTRALPLSYTPEYRWPGYNPGPPERLEKFIVSDL
jgi:hypothetical protein